MTHQREKRLGPAERRTRRAAVEDPAVVLDAALRYLEPRPRSVTEVRRHLVGAGYRQDLVEAAVERLVALGMLDDASFAAQWVESRDRARPRGAIALRRELRLKGIDPAIIGAVLEARTVARAPGPDGTAAAGGDADTAAAERLLARHARSLVRIADPRARRQRAYALLARNGFEPETCARLAARVVAPVDDGVEPAE